MKTILVVDDEREIRHMLRLMLEMSGYDVLEAVDGLDAIETAVDSTPDIILMDVMMPKLDGFSVCKQLREIETTARIPILMMSGDATTTYHKIEFEKCVDKFIRKPFQFGQLLGQIEQVLDQSVKVPA